MEESIVQLNLERKVLKLFQSDPSSKICHATYYWSDCYEIAKCFLDRFMRNRTLVWSSVNHLMESKS